MANSKVPKPKIEQLPEEPVAEAKAPASVVVEAQPAPEPKPKAEPAPQPKADPQPAPKAAHPKTTVKVDTTAEGSAPAAAKDPVQATDDSAGATTAPKLTFTSGPFAWISKLFPGHEHAVLGGMAGLIVALLFFFVGFWQTLFVSLLVCAGIALGQLQDGDPKIMRALGKLLNELRGTNE